MRSVNSQLAEHVIIDYEYTLPPQKNYFDSYQVNFMLQCINLGCSSQPNVYRLGPIPVSRKAL